MKEHKAKVLVLQDGRVVVEGVPVRAGQSVEVSIRFEGHTRPAWPLESRGSRDSRSASLPA